jgi:hypothetical protein
MKPTIINHPLRTITLGYNSEASLSDFEGAALMEYQRLHNQALSVKTQLSTSLEDIDFINKKLPGLKSNAHKLEDHVRLYRVVAGYKGNEASITDGQTLRPLDLLHKQQDFQQILNEYWGKRNSVVQNFETVKKDYDDLDNDYTTFRENYFSPIIQQWKNMEVDIVSLDRDVDSFCEELSAIDKLYQKVVTQWNEWINQDKENNQALHVLYPRIETIFKSLDFLSIFRYTGNKLVDCNSTGRLFLAKPGESIVKQYRANFETIAAKRDNNLVLTVEPDVIKDMQVGMMHEIMIALQHYPGLIEQLVFGIDFHFMMMEGLEIKLGEMEWKTKPAYYRWFCRLAESPVAIFFIKDNDARFYALAGDMMADGKIKARKEPHEKYTTFTPDGPQMQKIIDRLWHSCWFFLMYCHNSGFNPKIYIEALIAEYDMAFTYEDVREKYQEDVDKGIEFRVTKKK